MLHDAFRSFFEHKAEVLPDGRLAVSREQLEALVSMFAVENHSLRKLDILLIQKCLKQSTFTCNGRTITFRAPWSNEETALARPSVHADSAAKIAQWIADTHRDEGAQLHVHMLGRVFTASLDREQRLKVTGDTLAEAISRATVAFVEYTQACRFLALRRSTCQEGSHLHL